MRDANIYNFRRALPRMSWHPHNLYNLWRRSLGALKEDLEPRARMHMSLYQQRWASKAVLRAYHGDYINEKIFKRWYLPATLPDVRPHVGPTPTASDTVGLARWAKRDQAAEKERRRLENEKEKGLAPVGSLMFREVERRIDVVIFRACLAHSVYEARRLVIHGDVLLNGKKHDDPNTRLAPGDMVSVDPKAIRFLQASAAPVVEEDEAATKDQDTPPAAETSSEADVVVEEGVDGESEASAKSAASAETHSEPSATPSSNAARWTKVKRARRGNLTPFHPPPYSAPFLFVPAYIEPSFATCSAIYLRHPTARPGYSEIPTPFDADGEIVRSAWEWYSEVRPRMRSKSQLARMPENRQ
ncbi:hypothetical protein BKA93DRAFT_929346 [Sparassis latifolia]|uniref:RNA-binding S4 domain-containing protein n=1 Tax=Sparassis crispa TaxID=139825 RepID=A0A401GPM4_9APHY|nr:hypothetical protein SCP_0601440 [Sparassis crispa]GBE84166.1 hypothetical protein SCP_0601440 [Sparassis crispa]